MFTFTIGLLIFLIFSGFGCFFIANQRDKYNDPIEIMGDVSMVFAVFWFIINVVGLPVSYGGQISDVEIIQAEQEKIEIQKERLTRLTNLLDKFNYPESQTLANSDTPIGSVVEQISNVETDIADRKERIANLKAQIRWRSNWMWSYVVDWHPLEE